MTTGLSLWVIACLYAPEPCRGRTERFGYMSDCRAKLL